MNTERFCKLYTNYCGEEIDNPKQLTRHVFTGEELHEFVNYIEEVLNKEQGVDEGRRKDVDSKSEAGNPTNHPSIESSSIEREAVEDEIVGLLYKNKTDEADEGCWIDGKDFHKVASELYQLFLNSKNKQV